MLGTVLIPVSAGSAEESSRRGDDWRPDRPRQVGLNNGRLIRVHGELRPPTWQRAEEPRPAPAKRPRAHVGSAEAETESTQRRDGRACVSNASAEKRRGRGLWRSPAQVDDDVYSKWTIFAGD